MTWRVSSAHVHTIPFAEDGWIMRMVTQLKRWTLEEVHSLPDDGNRYELVRGQLFVTPPPSFDHEMIATRLARVLDRYVEAQKLGYVQRPRAVIRFEGSEAEPDLMVRPHAQGPVNWDTAPMPFLVVEILSPHTRRRDLTDKRSLYLDAGVEDYWIIDPEDRTIRSVRRDRDDLVVSDRLAWSPTGASEPLTVVVPDLFE